jgi:hypothetical protein
VGGGGGACGAGEELIGWGLEESSDGRQDSEKEDEEEEGHVEGAGLNDEGVRVTGLL